MPLIDCKCQHIYKSCSISINLLSFVTGLHVSLHVACALIISPKDETILVFLYFFMIVNQLQVSYVFRHIPNVDVEKTIS